LKNIIGLSVGAALTMGLVATGCGGEEGVEPSTSTATVGGEGGGGDSTTTSAQGGATTTGGGMGGGGPAPLPCLEESAYTDVLTLTMPEHCVVARYDVDGLDLHPMMWGRHGGLLTWDEVFGEIHIERIAVPVGASGTLTSAGVDGPIDSGLGYPVGWRSIHELPGTPWTIAAHSSATFSQGHSWDTLRSLDGAQAVRDWQLVDYWASVGLTNGATSRVLYSGASKLVPFAQAVNAVPGLYAADFDAAMPGEPTSMHLLEAVGPQTIRGLASDARGAVFGDASEVGGLDTHLLAWSANAVAPGQGGAASHTELAVLTNQWLSAGPRLAAVPLANAQGLLLYQPYHHDTSTRGDVMMLRYDASGAEVAAIGTPTAAIVPADEEYRSGIAMVTDPDGRLWLAMGRSVFVIAPEL